MEPLVTLSYSEWLVAEQLMRVLPPREGYSIYVPLSRQEKEIDLILARKAVGGSRVAALQVKYSRAYEKRPHARVRFENFFNSFNVGELADFFILATLYPNVTGRGGGKRSTWWLPLILVFTRAEMIKFIAGVSSKFYFGFDSPSRVLQTRPPTLRDFTKFTLANSVPKLRKHFGAA